MLGRIKIFPRQTKTLTHVLEDLFTVYGEKYVNSSSDVQMLINVVGK